MPGGEFVCDFCIQNAEQLIDDLLNLALQDVLNVCGDVCGFACRGG